MIMACSDSFKMLIGRGDGPTQDSKLSKLPSGRQGAIEYRQLIDSMLYIDENKVCLEQI